MEDSRDFLELFRSMNEHFFETEFLGYYCGVNVGTHMLTGLRVASRTWRARLPVPYKTTTWKLITNAARAGNVEMLSFIYNKVGDEDFSFVNMVEGAAYGGHIHICELVGDRLGGRDVLYIATGGAEAGRANICQHAFDIANSRFHDNVDFMNCVTEEMMTRGAQYGHLHICELAHSLNPSTEFSWNIANGAILAGNARLLRAALDMMDEKLDVQSASAKNALDVQSASAKNALDVQSASAKSALEHVAQELSTFVMHGAEEKPRTQRFFFPQNFFGLINIAANTGRVDLCRIISDKSGKTYHEEALRGGIQSESIELCMLAREWSSKLDGQALEELLTFQLALAIRKGNVDILMYLRDWAKECNVRCVWSSMLCRVGQIARDDAFKIVLQWMIESEEDPNWEEIARNLAHHGNLDAVRILLDTRDSFMLARAKKRTVNPW